jgi:hypothetical protein
LAQVVLAVRLKQSIPLQETTELLVEQRLLALTFLFMVAVGVAVEAQ